MGYLADFVTGRSINRHDRIVAMVIVRSEHGHPDPVTGAAKAPVYPADRFEPLSLPMRGKLDDYGYFEPDADDLGLEILLKSIKAPDWATVSKAINDLSEPYRFADPSPFNREHVAEIHPGIAVMHASTFDSLIAEGTLSIDTGDEVQRAAAIIHDAKVRWATDREDAYFNIAYMQTPHMDPYKTRFAEEISVPILSRVLGDMNGCHEMSRYLRDAIRNRHQNDHTSPDMSSLVATFTLLHDFHRAAYGLHWAQKYWQPSAFSRNDNLLTIAKLHADDLLVSMEGVIERLGMEDSEEVHPDLLQVAERLKATLATVEAEIEMQRSNALNP